MGCYSRVWCLFLLSPQVCHLLWFLQRRRFVQCRGSESFDQFEESLGIRGWLDPVGRRPTNFQGCALFSVTVFGLEPDQRKLKIHGTNHDCRDSFAQDVVDMIHYKMMNASRPGNFTKRAWKPGVFTRCHFFSSSKMVSLVVSSWPTGVAVMPVSCRTPLERRQPQNLGSLHCRHCLLALPTVGVVAKLRTKGVRRRVAWRRNMKAMEFLDMIVWEKFGPGKGVVFEPLLFWWSWITLHSRCQGWTSRVNRWTQ